MAYRGTIGDYIINSVQRNKGMKIDGLGLISKNPQESRLGR